MSEFASIAITLPMALALGFAYGAGPCLVSCAPYLTPIYLADSSEGKKSWGIIVAFSLGRIFGYAALGAMFAMIGNYIVGILKQNSHIAFVFGVAMALVGISLLFRLSASNCCGKSKNLKAAKWIPKDSKLFLQIGLFFLGASMAFNPCLPLGAIFVSAAASRDVVHGVLLGVAFGVGAIATSLLVFGVGVSYAVFNLKERLSNYRPIMQRTSAVLMMLIGIWNIATSIKIL